MSLISAEALRIAVGYFVPVELQRRQFHNTPIFTELVLRGFKQTSADTLQQVQPWCKWGSISAYLDCIAFADRVANDLPTGTTLDLQHVTPGRFYSAGCVFFAQALIDNIAVWFCEAFSLPVSGGERNFLKKPFTRELTKKCPTSEVLLANHNVFVEEVNRYRQVWIHTLAGGVLLTVDEDPFNRPELANKFLGVPIDPAINPDEASYRKRAERCATENNGRYLYPLSDFTKRIFNGASDFYLSCLRFALDNYQG